MQEYLDMWRNYINFTDRTTVRGCWMAVLVNALVILPLIIPARPASRLSIPARLYIQQPLFPSWPLLFAACGMPAGPEGGF